MVLGSAAPIRTRPDVRAPLVTMEAGASESVAPAVARFGEALYSYRLLRSRSGWAELETLGPDATTCAPSPAPLRAFRLLLYVREESLRPVTRMEVERRFGDGTSAYLARGVAVEQVRGSTHRVHFGPLIVPVELRPDAIGTRYLPSRFDEQPGIGWLRSRSLAALAVGLGGSRVEALPDTSLAVHAVEPAADGQHAIVRSRCGELRLQVSDDAVVNEPETPAEPESPAEPGTFVRAGAAVRWPDGRSAGSVRHNTPLGEARAEPGCYGLIDWDAVTLCFEPRDLSSEPPPERGLAGALATP